MPGFPSDLESYFEYNEQVYRTPPAPRKRGSGAWANLLDADFVTVSIVVNPPNSVNGRYTQTVGFADPDQQEWDIVAQSYAVRRMNLTTSATFPTPLLSDSSQTLTGTVTLGQRNLDVTVPLDESTRYQHQVDDFSIQDLLNAFGSMCGVGTAPSDTLPCAIENTKNQRIGTVKIQQDATIDVDFGAGASVISTIAMNAADPEEPGFLNRISGTVTAGGLRLIEIDFTYYGVPLTMTFPYEPLECPSRRPPNDPIDVPSLIRALRKLAQALRNRLRAPVKEMMDYAAEYFTDIDNDAVMKIGESLATATSNAGMTIALDDVANGFSQATRIKGPVTSSPSLMVNGLKSTGIAGADPETAVAVSAVRAVPSYTPSALVQALTVAFGADLAKAGVALAAAYGFSATVAGAAALINAIAVGVATSTPAQAISAAKAGIPSLSAQTLASAAVVQYPIGPTSPLTPTVLATTLASLTYSIADVGAALYGAMHPACASFVAAIYAAYNQGGVSTGTLANDVALACKAANYRLLDVALSMTQGPNRLFSNADARTALTAVYGGVPKVLTLSLVSPGTPPPIKPGGKLLVDFIDAYHFGGDRPFSVEVKFSGYNARYALAFRQLVGAIGFSFFVDPTSSQPRLTLFKQAKNANNQLIQFQASSQHPVPALDGGPHLVSLTYDGSQYAFFCDGISLGDPAQDPHTVPLGDTFYGALPPVELDINGDDLVRPASVNILEFRLWNRALPATDVERYMHELPTSTTSGLMGFWDYEDGRSADVTGKSAAHLTGAATITDAI